MHISINFPVTDFSWINVNTIKERVRNNFANWRRVFICIQGVGTGA